jgi:hypothetical protein
MAREKKGEKKGVQPYLLLVEANESFEKAELATKEAPTDAMKAQQNNTESHLAYLMSHGAFIMVPWCLGSFGNLCTSSKP